MTPFLIGVLAMTIFSIAGFVLIGEGRWFNLRGWYASIHKEPRHIKVRTLSDLFKDPDWMQDKKQE